MKLTEEQIIEAVRMARNGKTPAQIAAYFGVEILAISADFSKLRKLGVTIPFSPYRKKPKYDWASLVTKLNSPSQP